MRPIKTDRVVDFADREAFCQASSRRHPVHTSARQRQSKRAGTEPALSGFSL